ncbi:MAG: hypothetical protein ACRCYO_00835 [Bacteroidia bacterium]
MKNKINLFILLGFVTLSLSTCTPDEEEPNPADGRDVYVASWDASEQSSQVGQNNYVVHINKSTSNASQVLIENFYNIGFQFKAIAAINGNNLTIPQQTYNGNQLNGSGTKTGTNTIQMTYYMNTGSNIDTCVVTLTRQ